MQEKTFPERNKIEFFMRIPIKRGENQCYNENK